MNLSKCLNRPAWVGALTLCLSVGVVEADNSKRRMMIEGVVATGPNRFADMPLRDYGVVHGIPAGTLGFSELAVHNPDGPDTLPLTTTTEDSAVLATHADSDFLAFLGLTIDDIEPGLLNVPLQEVKTLVSKDGVTRGTLPPIFESVPMEPSIAAPNDTITWGDWKRASGVGVVRCDADGLGHVRLHMEKLIPNRIYTVWGGIFHTQKGLIEEPLGGAPPAFVTNRHGTGHFERVLNFCPFDFIEEANAQLGWLMILLHSDHMVYGGVFAPEEAGLIGGVTSNVHMEFHFMGEPVYE